MLKQAGDAPEGFGQTGGIVRRDAAAEGGVPFEQVEFCRDFCFPIFVGDEVASFFAPVDLRAHRIKIGLDASDILHRKGWIGRRKGRKQGPGHLSLAAPNIVSIS